MIALVLACLSMGACTSHPIDQRIRMSITGTWKGDQTGALLTIFGDGRIVLENAKGSAQPIKGKIDRGFDEILFTYLTPAAVCKDATGVYRFTSDGRKLTLEPLREDCPARAAQLDKSWSIANRIPTTQVQ